MIKKRPLVVGLTGSIGMGKSTVADMFGRLGLPVLSADTVVHALLASGGAAVARVARHFPDTLVKGAIDRQKLAALVVGCPTALEKLEKILHPFVWRAERAFIQKARQAGARGVLLEIPLLFETKSEKRMDVVVCVHAKAQTQKERVMKRAGMTAGRLRFLLSRQMSSREKKARADYVISTDCSLAETRKAVKKTWQEILERQGLKKDA